MAQRKPNNELETRIASMEENVAKLDIEFKKCAYNYKKMKDGPSKNMERKKALRVLRLKKKSERKLDRLRDQLFNTEEIHDLIQSCKDNVAVAQTMKLGVKEMHKSSKKVEPADVEGQCDELEDMLNLSNEIQDVLGHSSSRSEDYDEDDLEAELDALQLSDISTEEPVPPTDNTDVMAVCTEKRIDKGRDDHAPRKDRDEPGSATAIVPIPLPIPTPIPVPTVPPIVAPLPPAPIPSVPTIPQFKKQHKGKPSSDKDNKKRKRDKKERKEKKKRKDKKGEEDKEKDRKRKNSEEERCSGEEKDHDRPDLPSGDSSSDSEEEEVKPKKGSLSKRIIDKLLWWRKKSARTVQERTARQYPEPTFSAQILSVDIPYQGHSPRQCQEPNLENEPTPVSCGQVSNEEDCQKHPNVQEDCQQHPNVQDCQQYSGKEDCQQHPNVEDSQECPDVEESQQSLNEDRQQPHSFHYSSKSSGHESFNKKSNYCMLL